MKQRKLRLKLMIFHIYMCLMFFFKEKNYILSTKELSQYYGKSAITYVNLIEMLH